MKPGRYSRWSIIIAAILGTMLVAAGLLLLHRADVERPEPTADEQER